MFYVLEGEVEIKLGNETIQGQPGAFVLVPRGTFLTKANLGTTPAPVINNVYSWRRARKVL
jgi:mannose-6-phosphate isomerase-like protein (cupin superfamily)